MLQSAIAIGLFLAVLACAPLALKWYKQRTLGVNPHFGGQARFISALAVGPHQRVVTVEIGPEGRRVWLTLGVTDQAISCLHCVDISDGVATPNSGGHSPSSLSTNLRETESL